MTVYEYLIQQKRKLIKAFCKTGQRWMAEKISELQIKIENLTIEEAGRDYRPPRR